MQISTINSSISENSNNYSPITKQNEADKNTNNHQIGKKDGLDTNENQSAETLYGGNLFTNKDGDTLEISDACTSASSENTISDDILQDLINQADSASDSGDTYAKIIKIFQRIARGDHVHANDEFKLMEFSKELYQAAKEAAVMAENKKPKDYKSVDEEEENKPVTFGEGAGAVASSFEASSEEMQAETADNTSEVETQN